MTNLSHLLQEVETLENTLYKQAPTPAMADLIHSLDKAYRRFIGTDRVDSGAHDKADALIIISCLRALV